MDDCPDHSKMWETGFLSTDVTTSKISQSPTAPRDIRSKHSLRHPQTPFLLLFEIIASNTKTLKTSPFDYFPPPRRSPSIFMAWEKSPEQHACYYIQIKPMYIPSPPSPHRISSPLLFKYRLLNPESPPEKNFSIIANPSHSALRQLENVTPPRQK